MEKNKIIIRRIKEEKLQFYALGFKLSVIEHAEKHGNSASASATEFNVSVK